MGLAFVALFWCSTAYAPILSGFPGLRELIDEADVVAVATVLQEVPIANIGGMKLMCDDCSGGFGGWGNYEVDIRKVLKGKPRHNRATVILRKLWPRTETQKEWWARNRIEHPHTPNTCFEWDEGTGPFEADKRYLLFLKKVEKEIPSDYENVNCEGSSYRVSPYTDVNMLDGKSPEEAVKLLLSEYVEFKRMELKRTEEQVEFLQTHRPPEASPDDVAVPARRPR